MNTKPHCTFRPASIPIILLASVWTLIGPAGCAQIEKPYPAKQHFIIDAGNPAVTQTTQQGTVLRVQRLRVAHPFARQSFVYRRSQSEYETDYYHVFTADPALLITGETIQWLDNTRLFDAVIDTASSIDHQYLLEGQVTALYGDFMPDLPPRAVLNVKFFLIDDRGHNSQVHFQNEYSQTEPLPEPPDASSLANAWGDCLRRILAALADDLNNLNYK